MKVNHGRTSGTLEAIPHERYVEGHRIRRNDEKSVKVRNFLHTVN